ncbi:MAG: TrmJ/YjtD family RNA methyltransferase [Nanoarchaeota archaeon]|nr:TrmJ/YjtD family RNA methyltransferase [Nanoarchaeota archaeon]
MITVVLVEPENSGNIGAVARSMQNFDLDKLLLISPKAEHLNDEAFCRARHAKIVLQKAKVKDYSYFIEDRGKSIRNDFSIIFGTTSVLGSDYNLPRLPIPPEKLAENIPSKKNVAIVFGRESKGLSNKEISVCDLIVTISSSTKYSAMNLSHAASIIFYELYKKQGEEMIDKHIELATRKEREVILDKIDVVLERMDFSTPEKRDTQRLVWKNLISKGFLTKREAYALIGFLRKLDK